jgi:nucleosome binding factor SPN SPT16 subunit
MMAAKGGVSAEEGEAAEEAALADVPPIRSYGSSTEFTQEARACVVSVDKDKETVLIPLYGHLVPFHIATIKSVSKNEEGGISYLRFTFYTAGASLGKGAPRQTVASVARNPVAAYIKTLTLRSKDGRNLSLQMSRIKDVQRQIRAREAAAQETEGLAELPKLVLTRSGRVPSLRDVNMWPALSGRKTVGDIEAHANGLRFISNKSERLDIIYSNIKHAILQPCEQETTVLVHFNLKQPVLVGRKKVKDIQFYTEVIEAAIKIDGAARSAYDPDELNEEAQERKKKQMLNKIFAKFVQDVENVADRDESSAFSAFDIPNRSMAFRGAPDKEMVLIQPCDSCLVSLSEKPVFVLSLADIEHVHFERVMFSSKNFDMAVILKAGTKQTGKPGEDEFVRINAVPMAELDTIKTWLDSVVGITFTQGTANMNWKQVIPDIVRDPAFYTDVDPNTGDFKPVGWDWLAEKSEDSAELEEDDEDGYSEEEAEAEADEEDDEFSENVTDEDSDDSDDYDDDEEEEEGEDWDELERQAAEDDKRAKLKARDDDDDDRPPPRKKHKGRR